VEHRRAGVEGGDRREQVKKLPHYPFCVLRPHCVLSHPQEYAFPFASVDRACPSTWQARRSETRSGSHLSLPHLCASPLCRARGFPRRLPSGSGCPKTDPLSASSTGHSPSPGTSNAWPDSVEALPIPSATGTTSARSPRSVCTPGSPSVRGLDPPLPHAT